MGYFPSGRGLKVTFFMFSSISDLPVDNLWLRRAGETILTGLNGGDPDTFGDSGESIMRDPDLYTVRGVTGPEE